MTHAHTRSIAAMAGGLALLLFAQPAQASCAAPPTLDGLWRANDGGTYTVRVAGTSIWWIGRSADGGKTWQNVFHGTRSGSTITGTWADVGGRVRGAGSMTLRVSGTAFMERTAAGGSGFGGTRWTRPCDDVVLVPAEG